jgi:hypothetical protein
MRRALGSILTLVLTATALGPVACTGAQGAMGKPGEEGVETPSVSAVTPPYAYVGRTVNLSIIGDGTSWGDKTTVAFADPGVKVNKVTAASATGLLVNVTVGASATLETTDVTVTDDAGKAAVYKGAFEVRAPLQVTTDQTGGVPQGGLATVHVVMLDLTTPFDPDTAALTLSSTALTMTSDPTVADFAIDFQIEADVLAQVGSVDVDVTSGVDPSVVDSVAKKAFTIAARAAKTLTTAAAATGTIQTVDDTALYAFTPAGANQRFVQFTIGSMSGQLAGTVISQSGEYADALSSGFGVRYGEGTTSADPLYVIVADSDSLFGVGPTPADLSVTAFEATCTAVSETAETDAVNDDTPATAQMVAPPVLVNGTLGYGANDPAADIDFYEITVSGAPKTIHAATGGDPLDDTVLQILDSGMNVVATSDDLDYQEDLTYAAASSGVYYVSVTSSTSGAFSASDNTYQLFIEVK